MSDKPSSWYAELYQRDQLTGGHVIMLGADDASRWALAIFEVHVRIRERQQHLQPLMLHMQQHVLLLTCLGKERPGQTCNTVRQAGQGPSASD